MIVNIEPTIAAAAPTPVEMNLVVIVVAVKNVGVAASTMHHWPAHIDGLNEELHVAFVRMVLTTDVDHLVGIVEI